MKGLIKRLCVVLFVFCLLSNTFIYKTLAEVNELNAADTNYLKKNNFQVVAKNTLMTLYANDTNGEFAVEDNRNHFVWYSNPRNREEDKVAQGVNKMDLSSQLSVTYTDYSDDNLKLKNNYSGSILKKTIKFEKVTDGFKVTYSFPADDNFSIPLIITLKDNYLSAEVDVANISEKNNFIYSMTLLPYFGAGSLNDKGYIFVPDGSGALINFNNNKQNVEAYTEAIYGRDETFASNQNPTKREAIKLPVFGIKNGDNAFLAIVDKGESQANIIANVSGIKSAYNNVYASFDIRKFDSFTVGQSGQSMRTTRIFEKGNPKIGGCKIKYYLLQGSQADYSGMAKSYRDYLIKENGLIPNTDIKPQMYLDLYGAVRKQKSILGIPFNIVQPLTTYKNTINILNELKQSGVNDIVVNYHDWNSDSIDSAISTSASTIGKLGGDKGFKELITYSNANNIKLFPQVDFLQILKGKINFLKSFNESKTLGTVPATMFEYRLSTYFKNNEKPIYNLLAPSSLSKVVEKFDKSYQKYKINGIGLNTLSSMVYSDYTKNAASVRQETEAKWIDSMKQMKKEFGNVVASAPNAYALPYVDYVLDVPSDSSHYYIEDETIPFYEMVIRGVKPYTIDAFNFSANKNEQLLKAVESGANPYYVWIGEDTSVLKETKHEGLYSASYKAWKSTAVSDFGTFKNLYTKIQNSTIDKHEKLAEGVFKTTYSNGTSVIVNYSSKEFWIDNRIVAPMNFLIDEGGNKK